MPNWAYLRLVSTTRGELGPPQSALLQAIAKYGSLTVAAKAVGTTYECARREIRFLNRYLGGVVLTTRGRHGGAHLTTKAQKILKLYLTIERDFYKVFTKDLTRIESLVGDRSMASPVPPRWARVEEPRQTERTKRLNAIMPGSHVTAAQQRKDVRRTRVKAVTSHPAHVPVWVFLALGFLGGTAGFGPYRSALLEAFAKYGSIKVAAAAIGQDFPRAQSVVRDINKQFGEMVAIKKGRYGGAYLTPKAQKLLHHYRKIERKFYQVFAEDLIAFEMLVGGDPKAPQRIPRWARVEEPKRARPRNPAALSTRTKKINKKTVRENSAAIPAKEHVNSRRVKAL